MELLKKYFRTLVGKMQGWAYVAVQMHPLLCCVFGPYIQVKVEHVGLLTFEVGSKCRAGVFSETAAFFGDVMVQYERHFPTAD